MYIYPGYMYVLLVNSYFHIYFPMLSQYIYLRKAVLIGGEDGTKVRPRTFEKIV